MAAQQGDPDSVLNLYRTALSLRRTRLARLPETLTWTESAADVLSFTRPDGFHCLTNLSPTPRPLPGTRRWSWPAAPWRRTRRDG